MDARATYEAKLSREKNAYLLLKKHGGLPFFLSNFSLPVIIFLFKELEKITGLKTDSSGELEMRYSRR